MLLSNVRKCPKRISSTSAYRQSPAKRFSEPLPICRAYSKRFSQLPTICNSPEKSLAASPLFCNPMPRPLAPSCICAEPQQIHLPCLRPSAEPSQIHLPNYRCLTLQRYAFSGHLDELGRWESSTNTSRSLRRHKPHSSHPSLPGSSTWRRSRSSVTNASS